MYNLVSEIQASNEVYDHQLCPLSHHALLTETRLFLKSLVGSIAVICVCCGIFVSRSWLWSKPLARDHGVSVMVTIAIIVVLGIDHDERWAESILDFRMSFQTVLQVGALIVEALTPAG